MVRTVPVNWKLEEVRWKTHCYSLFVAIEGGKVKDRKPRFTKGDRVTVSSKSASPYRGCSGVVERVVEEKSGFLYIVQFGKSGELALTDNFLEENLQTIGG